MGLKQGHAAHQYSQLYVHTLETSSSYFLKKELKMRQLLFCNNRVNNRRVSFVTCNTEKISQLGKVTDSEKATAEKGKYSDRDKNTDI